MRTAMYLVSQSAQLCESCTKIPPIADRLNWEISCTDNMDEEFENEMVLQIHTMIADRDTVLDLLHFLGSL